MDHGMPPLIDWDLESTCERPVTTVVDDTRFAGKTIVVTGAGGQFGREGCIYFVRRGARIAALDRSKNGLKETFDELMKEFGKNKFDFKPYVCDVTDAVQIKLIIESIAFRFKTIDCLWNNAGYQGKIKNTLDYDPEDFAMVMNINVTGLFIVLQAVAKQMASQPKSKDGYCIVNTASVAGLRGTPGMIAYASSKAAVVQLTVTAAKDLAHHGIRVNCVSPALIGPGFMWERQNKLHSKIGPPFYSTNPEEVANNKINMVPMKRLGSVEEVVKVVSFLMCEQSSYMTGSNLVVDGGMAAGIKG